WGMVRYGYASTVDQMVERLSYDLLYLENLSFGIDIKILFHTVQTVLAGRGM
ncbi:MAG: sugar transferase, partial [Muribaculaceae bacterium]|nr:sugar transferase [Muribaculaceae bacterium]